MLSRRSAAFALAALVSLTTIRASAQEPPPNPTPPADPTPPTEPTPTGEPTPPPTTPPPTPSRLDLTPKPLEPPPSPKIRFQADPIGDTGALVVALTFSLLSNEVLSTGEVRPQQISPTFQKSELLGIDRGAVTNNLDSNANRFSNYGLYTAVGYVLVDTVLDIWREGGQAALVDGIMYAEAGSITQGVTNIAKIAFRRPRPIAYINRQTYLNNGGDPNTYNNSETDSSLSFFSGHASGVASLSSAATYIAFSRSPRSWRPWATLAGGVALTSFVSYERVRSGAHFPTDVMAGALAGAGIGALVVHLHREDAVRQRPVWIGTLMPTVTPVKDGGVVGAAAIF